MKKTTLFILLIILIMTIMQFFSIDKSVPQTDPESDFIVVKNPRRKVSAALKSSCYDCHSYKTNYPWYSNVAHASWLLQSHIKKGRKQLNFSEFGQYPREQKNSAMQQMKNSIEERRMPLKLYTLMHRKAKLNEGMRENILRWLSEGKNAVEQP